MGFLNKLKNVFFEEEEIEVEEKPKKEKPIAKKVELPKKEKRKVEEEQITSNEDLDRQEQREEELSTEVEVGETYTPKEKKQGFKFPVLLEDDLIEEEIKVEEKPMRRSERKEKVEPLYKEKVETKKVEKKADRDHPFNNSYTRDLNSVDYSLHDRKNDVKGFKPSPIISPIYGVLDKNYKKEEIHDKKETHTTSFSFTNDKLDLDSVRRKAFGGDIALDIEQDIEEEVEENTPVEIEDTTLDMTDTNMTPVVDKVTVGDAEEYFSDLGLEYNVDYKDSSKEAPKKRGRTKTEEEYEDVTKDAVIEEEKDPIDLDVREEKEKEEKKTRSNSKKEDIEIEDNLFDLIDSMYDEGE